MASSGQSKQKHSPSLNNSKTQLGIDWFSGLVAGFVSVTACAPLELARTRLIIVGKTDAVKDLNYGGFWKTLATVYQHEGIRGFYKGYNATALVITLFHSFYFAIYNYSKKKLKNTEFFKSDYSVNFISATIAGLTCDFATNPLWVVKTRLQTQHIHDVICDHQHTRYESVITGLKTMVREEGLLSLWKGFGAQIYGLMHVAVMFPMYERLKVWRQEVKKKELNDLDIILCSSISKSIPFSYIFCMLSPTILSLRNALDLSSSCHSSQDDRTPWKGEPTTKILKKKGFLRTGIRMLEKEGLSSLYAGFKVDMIRVLPSTAITFAVFEKMRAYLQKKYLH